MYRRAAIRKLLAPLLLSSLSFAPTAQARGRVRIRSTGLTRGMTNAGPVMSREELRSCLQRESALNLRSDEIDREEAALKVSQSELSSLEALIDRRLTTIDRYNKGSVNSHNALITKQRKLVRAYNDRIERFNTLIAGNKIDQDNFNIACAGKAYYDADMQAVRAAPK
jgi:hypothetical protein